MHLDKLTISRDVSSHKMLKIVLTEKLTSGFTRRCARSSTSWCDCFFAVFKFSKPYFSG